MKSQAKARNKAAVIHSAWFTLPESPSVAREICHYITLVHVSHLPIPFFLYDQLHTLPSSSKSFKMRLLCVYVFLFMTSALAACRRSIPPVGDSKVVALRKREVMSTSTARMQTATDNATAVDTAAASAATTSGAAALGNSTAIVNATAEAGADQADDDTGNDAGNDMNNGMDNGIVNVMDSDMINGMDKGMDNGMGDNKESDMGAGEEGKMGENAEQKGEMKTAQVMDVNGKLVNVAVVA
ncbi:MAG: hypothetical protein Q9171_000304 [Xanthocarpia ochracea]